MYNIKEFLEIHKQKILIITLAIIALVLIIVAVLMVLSLHKKNLEEKNLTKFMSSDQKIAITLPDNLSMDIVTDPSYELLLNSISDGNAIGISKTQKNPIYTFDQFASSDKSTYISNFENPQNITEISRQSINQNTYLKYSFNTQDAYIEVYWIEKNDFYYIIDFACDTKSGASDLKDNINTIMNSLTFND